jgi:hypothetical protein
MKLKITSALLSLAGSSLGALVSISSVGVNYNGTDDYGILLSNGSPVAPLGGIARAGFFSTLTNLQVDALAAAQNYTLLFAPGNFTTIVSDDFTGIVGAYGANAGFVSASISGYNAAGLNNSLYVYITSGTEIGLFRSSFTIVPDSVTPPESNYSISFGSGSAVIGAYGPDYQVAYTGIAPGPMMVNSFQLVPEPSVAFLGALGALGLLRRRRI